MIYTKLLAVQQALKAPKDQFNDFGKYKYRSCENILESVKPLLAENALALTLTDEIVPVGDRIYVRATAKLFDTEATDSMDFVTVSAYAREEDTKKGMDASQVTGAASSYARKYALNGLFCIDDTKDSDFTNQTPKETPKETDFQPKCADCGAYITDRVHDFSVKKYGRPLCRNCQT